MIAFAGQWCFQTSTWSPGSRLGNKSAQQTAHLKLKARCTQAPLTVPSPARPLRSFRSPGSRRRK